MRENIFKNINRQMSEELLLNDRRGNLIHGLSIDHPFFMGPKNLAPTGMRTTASPIYGHPH